MADRKDDGGPAFPLSDLSNYGIGPSEVSNSGMSLRAWLAGMAITGAVSETTEFTRPSVIAERAIAIADAVMKVLQK